MTPGSQEKKPTPPYVSYTTLKNFLERFKQGVPGRIDRDVMGTMSGAAQSQVTTSLRYLKFISEHGLPTEAFKQYVKLEGEERQAALKVALKDAYPFIFNAQFDFDTATVSLLREEFEKHTGASGETLDRCMSFLKDAAADAGIQVSRFLSEKKSRPNGARGKRVPQARRTGGSTGEAPKEYTTPALTSDQGSERVHHRSHPPIEAQSSLLLWGLFARLPKPGSAWPKGDRDRWTQTLENVLSLEYKDSE